MRNVLLCCIGLSFVLLINSLLYPSFIGPLTEHQAIAQFAKNMTIGTDITKLMMTDTIQALMNASLDNKDVSGALEQLNSIDQKLGIGEHSTPTQTKLLVEGAIQALQNGDINTALDRVLLANQQLGSVTSSSSQENTKGVYAAQTSGQTHNNKIYSSAKPKISPIISGSSQENTKGVYAAQTSGQTHNNKIYSSAKPKISPIISGSSQENTKGVYAHKHLVRPTIIKFILV